MSARPLDRSWGAAIALAVVGFIPVTLYAAVLMLRSDFRYGYSLLIFYAGVTGLLLFVSTRLEARSLRWARVLRVAAPAIVFGFMYLTLTFEIMPLMALWAW